MAKKKTKKAVQKKKRRATTKKARTVSSIRKKRARSVSLRSGVSVRKGKKRVTKRTRKSESAKKKVVKRRSKKLLSSVQRKNKNRKRKVGARKNTRRSKTRSASLYSVKDEINTITCGGKGRDVPLLGNFTNHKRIISFKRKRKASKTLPNKSVIKNEAGKWFDKNGDGNYFYRAKLSLIDGNGNKVDRFFSPFTRQFVSDKKVFQEKVPDLLLTMEMMARGYLTDGKQNYTLDDLELEFISAQESLPIKKAS